MRMWEIRENDMDKYRDTDYRRMGNYKKDPYEESYECGYEDGYRAAMKEAKSYYGERRMR